MANLSDNEASLAAIIKQLDVLADQAKKESRAIQDTITNLSAKKSGIFGANQEALEKAKQQSHDLLNEGSRILILKSELMKLDPKNTSFVSDLRALMLINYMDEFAAGSKRKNSLAEELGKIIPESNAADKKSPFVLTNQDMDSERIIKHLFNRAMYLLTESKNAKSEEVYVNYMKLLSASGPQGLADFKVITDKNFNPVIRDIILKSVSDITSEKEIKAGYNNLIDNFELKADIIRYANKIPKEQGALKVLEGLREPTVDEKAEKQPYRPGSLDI